MANVDQTSWEILNATADDCENLEQIYRAVCFECIELPIGQGKLVYDYRPISCAPLLSEIADRIRRLVDDGLLAAVTDEEGNGSRKTSDLDYVWRAWFQMTSAGRITWESSAQFLKREETP